MRVLLIEDDTGTAEAISGCLRADGSICDSLHLGEEALEISRLYEYDIIILDLLLPDIDGHELLKKLRMARIRTPVLILSGMQDVGDRVKALGFGADDYLTKPFSYTELSARIQAIVRRSRGHAEPQIRIGELTVNLEARTATAAEKTLKLTGKEYQILELLALRRGITINKEMFLNYMYGGIDEPEIKIVDVFMCKLRRKISDTLGRPHAGVEYIETVWGRGYVLKAPGEEAAPFELHTPDEEEKAPAYEVARG